jgi:hypothetical protein
MADQRHDLIARLTTDSIDMGTYDMAAVADRDPTYTPDPADVELVAKAFIAEAKKNPVDTSHYSWGVTSRLLVGPNEFDIARAVLAALAAAGRLLPADARVDVLWAWDCLDQPHGPCLHEGSEGWVRETGPALWPGGQIMTRWRAARSWLPAPVDSKLSGWCACKPGTTCGYHLANPASDTEKENRP